MSFRGRIVISPVEGKQTEKHPDYLIRLNGLERGAAWNKVSRDGLEYISCSVAGPELGPDVIYFNLGRASRSDNPNEFNLIYNARKPKKRDEA